MFGFNEILRLFLIYLLPVFNSPVSSPSVLGTCSQKCFQTSSENILSLDRQT